MTKTLRQQFSSVQLLSRVWLFAIPWSTASQASLFIINSPNLHKFMSIESVMPSSHLIFCYPLLLRPPIHPASGFFPLSHSSHDVIRVLDFQVQQQSFQWTARTDLLQDGLVASPCSPRDSQESAPTPQFKNVNFLALSFLHSPNHIHTRPLEKS